MGQVWLKCTSGDMPVANAIPPSTQHTACQATIARSGRPAKDRSLAGSTASALPTPKLGITWNYALRDGRLFVTLSNGENPDAAHPH